MTSPKTSFEDILKINGYSLTKQRQLIFDALAGQEPMTMFELYEKVKDAANRASVYRIIDVLEKTGIVKRINIGWKYKIELSDKFAEHHHHLTCLKCHRVIPINEAELEAFVSSLSSQLNFLPTDHQIEIQGYCLNCQQ